MCRIECKTARIEQFERTPSLLTDYSVTSALRGVISTHPAKIMQLKYRLFQRAKGAFYWQENGTSRRGSLHTKDRQEAELLVKGMNESHRQPTLNLALGRAYLSAHDSEMPTRTWQKVMDAMSMHGIEVTRKRCARAFASRAFNGVRDVALIQTKPEELLLIMHSNGNTAAHYLRRLHNLALNLGWLAWPILPKNAWPKLRRARKRAITATEHASIVAAEKNPERRAFYQLLYETGASQTDAANLRRENVDVESGVLVYQRRKLGVDSEPARLTMGSKLRALLVDLPSAGDLFPSIKRSSANDRAAEFRRRCRLLGISGVSLHSYRHAWAQRAKACGYPQRFAQEALGHSSHAVHEAYARGAVVVCPALEEYEADPSQKVIRMPAAPTKKTALR